MATDRPPDLIPVFHHTARDAGDRGVVREVRLSGERSKGARMFSEVPAHPRDEEEAAHSDDHDEAEKVEQGYEEEAQQEADGKDEKHDEQVHRRSLGPEATVNAEPDGPQKREQVLGDRSLPRHRLSG
jgi:hypothetical protein